MTAMTAMNASPKTNTIDSSSRIGLTESPLGHPWSSIQVKLSAQLRTAQDWHSERNNLECRIKEWNGWRAATRHRLTMKAKQKEPDISRLMSEQCLSVG